MALQIVLHTFRMIFRNFGQALRVSLGPTIVLLLGDRIFLFVFTQIPESMNFLGQLAALALILLSFFVSAWIAVSWHRFVLLEEYPSLLPATRGRPIWPYVGKMLLMLLILILIGGVFLASYYFLIIIYFGSGGNNVGQLVNFFTLLCTLIALAVLIVTSLRMGSALVATALGKNMTFRASVDATRSIGGVIWRIVFIMLIVAVPLNFVGDFLASTDRFVGAIVEAAYSWLATMFGASILTTIYGHVIEDRPLVSN